MKHLSPRPRLSRRTWTRILFEDELPDSSTASRGIASQMWKNYCQARNKKSELPPSGVLYPISFVGWQGDSQGRVLCIRVDYRLDGSFPDMRALGILPAIALV